MSGWQDEAACRGKDPAMFFPGKGDNLGVAAAKAVCADCPVKAECLAENLHERVGVYGGTSDRQRRRIRAARSRVAA